MLSCRQSCVVIITAMLTLGSVALAQRREGSTAPVVLEVQLKESVKFGNVVVPAHTYRLNLSADGLAFADVETMVFVATVPVQITEVGEAAAEPTATVKQTGAKVEVTVKIGKQVARAEGVTGAAIGQDLDVMLDSRAEAIVKDATPEEQSERALVEQGVQLYLSGIKHCADQVHKGRWGTDDPRFVKCVCPVLAKWRLPKVKARLRIDLPLAKGHSGFSFTAMPDGRPIECRVWAGAAPPLPLVTATPPAAEPPSPPTSTPP
jgi:hypothetical protein